MSNSPIGLIGTGSSSWIAGVNYIRSLLFANSMLQDNQQQELHLLLHEFLREEKVYEEVSHYAASKDYFDFVYGVSFPNLRAIEQMLRRAWKTRTFPARVRNNLPAMLLEKECEIIFPANKFLKNGPSQVKKISWIPDFQFAYFPENYSNPSRQQKWVGKILEQSDLVIVSNPFSQDDVQRLFSKFVHKVRVLPFTMWLGPDWLPHDHEAVIEKHNLSRKYFIFPSQFWVHKNHRRLFEAISYLKQKAKMDIQLVCTGHPADFRQPKYVNELLSYIEEQDLGNNIRILGLLPRADQVQLMRGAAAVIQPSLFEGHSALVDEAQSLGKELLISDIPMHREPNAAGCYFDPYDVQDLAKSLENMWQCLAPGPDMDAEEQAMKKYHMRLKRFGQQFNEICKPITEVA
jgi:glycosyltransferase involved in cell wall biosynthesis